MSQWTTGTIRRTSRVGGAVILTGGVIAATPAVAWAGTGAASFHEADEAGQWALFLALVLLGGLSSLISHGLKGLIVGFDLRLSTSKTVAAAWTFLLASGLLSIVLTKLIWGYAQSYDTSLTAALDSRYGLLIGGPLGAAILAKQIVTKQVASDPKAKTMSTTGASATDLVTNDANRTDLGDLQYVLFNFVAMVYFVGLLISSAHKGLPQLPDGLLELTSVSAVGYVGKKALTPPAAMAQILVRATAPPSPFTIAGKGLVVAGAAPQVLFGTVPAAAVTIGPPVPGDDRDVLVVTSPPAPAAGQPQEVDVLVVVPPGTRLNAGRFAW